MPKEYQVGDTVVNQQGVACTVIEHADDYYILETPNGSIENITDSELDQLD